MAAFIGALSRLRSPIKSESQATAPQPQPPDPATVSMEDTSFMSLPPASPSTLGKPSFDIHQGLLKRHSFIFRDLASAEDPKLASGVFELNGHGYDTVNLMKEWLYRGRLAAVIPSPRNWALSNPDDDFDRHDSPATDDRSQTMYGTQDLVLRDSQSRASGTKTGAAQEDSISVLSLTKLYVLSEELDMPKLCREAAATLIEQLEKDEDLPIGSLIHAQAHTKQDSLIYEMLLAFTARFISSKDIKKVMASSMPLDLIRDLLFAIIRLSEAGDNNSTWHDYAIHEGFINE